MTSNLDSILERAKSFAESSQPETPASDLDTVLQRAKTFASGNTPTQPTAATPTANQPPPPQPLSVPRTALNAYARGGQAVKAGFQNIGAAVNEAVGLDENAALLRSYAKEGQEQTARNFPGLQAVMDPALQAKIAAIQTRYNGQETPESAKEVSEAVRDALWRQKPLARAAEVVTEGVPAWIGAIAATLATKNPMTGAAILGAQQGAGTYAEARDSGQGAIKSLLLGAGDAALSTYLEKLPFESFLGNAGKKALERFVKGAGAEALQEVVQNAASNLIAKYGYDKGRDIFDNWLEAVVGGAGLGGIGGLAFGPATTDAPAPMTQADTPTLSQPDQAKLRQMPQDDRDTVAAMMQNGTPLDTVSRWINATTPEQRDAALTPPTPETTVVTSPVGEGTGINQPPAAQGMEGQPAAVSSPATDSSDASPASVLSDTDAPLQAEALTRLRRDLISRRLDGNEDALPADVFTPVAPPSDMRKAEVDAAETAARLWGKGKIVYFKNNRPDVINFNGTVTDDTIFINVDTKDPFVKVAMHESLHRFKGESPDLYRQFIDVLKQEGTGFDAYKKKLLDAYTKQNLEVSKDDDWVWDEIAADVMGERGTDQTFWQDLYQRSPDAVRAIVDTIKRVIDAISGKATTPEMAQYFKNFQAVHDAAVSVLAQNVASRADTTAVNPSQPVSSDRLASSPAQSGGTPSLTDEPLGLNRQPVLDRRLESLGDDAFEKRRAEITRLVDSLEKDFDEKKGAISREERKRLATVQDDYDAIENESFRRKMMDAHPEDVSLELRKLGSTDTDKLRTLILMDVIEKRGIVNEITADMTRFVGTGKNFNADKAEVVSGKLTDLSKLAPSKRGGTKPPPDKMNAALDSLRTSIRKVGIKPDAVMTKEDMGGGLVGLVRKDGGYSWDQVLEEAYAAGLITDAERSEPSTIAKLMTGRNLAESDVDAQRNRADQDAYEAQLIDDAKAGLPIPADAWKKASKDVREKYKDYGRSAAKPANVDGVDAYFDGKAWHILRDGKDTTLSDKKHGEIIATLDAAMPKMKPEPAPFSLAEREQDARYLELAKDPEANRDELQRMVDEAAKAKGGVQANLSDVVAATGMLKDHLDSIVPTATISGSVHFGTRMTHDGEAVEFEEVNWYVNTAAANDPFTRYPTYESARDAARLVGFDAPDTIPHPRRYNPSSVSVTHRVAKQIADSMNPYLRGEDHGAEQVYVRFGKIPPRGISTNHGTGESEAGTSVFRAIRTRDGRVLVQPVTNQELGSLLAIRNRPLFFIEGKEVGEGSDGEPLLRKPRITGEAKEWGPTIPRFYLFDENKVKSADPITYDDQGNVIPLSQRFNPQSNDIRFSLADLVAKMDDGDTKQGKLAARVEKSDLFDAAIREAAGRDRYTPVAMDDTRERGYAWVREVGNLDDAHNRIIAKDHDLNDADEAAAAVAVSTAYRIAIREATDTPTKKRLVTRSQDFQKWAYENYRDKGRAINQLKEWTRESLDDRLSAVMLAQRMVDETNDPAAKKKATADVDALRKEIDSLTESLARQVATTDGVRRALATLEADRSAIKAVLDNQLKEAEKYIDLLSTNDPALNKVKARIDKAGTDSMAAVMAFAATLEQKLSIAKKLSVDPSGKPLPKDVYDHLTNVAAKWIKDQSAKGARTDKAAWLQYVTDKINPKLVEFSNFAETHSQAVLSVGVQMKNAAAGRKGLATDAAIRKQLKQMGTSIAELVYEHYSVQDATAKTLVQRLTDAGYGKNATNLALEIQKAMNRLMETRAKQVLDAAYGEKEKRTRGTKNTMEQMLREMRLGALTDARIQQLFAEKYGLNALTPEGIAEIERRSDRIAELAAKFKDNPNHPDLVDEKEKAMRFISTQVKVNARQLFWGWAYASMLSGPVTHLFNVTATNANAGSAFAVRSLQQVVKAAKSPRELWMIPLMVQGAVNGFRFGLADANHALKTGINPVKYNEKHDADPKDANIYETHPFLSKFALTRWVKWPRRLLAAEDAIPFMSMHELQAALVAWNEVSADPGLTGRQLYMKAAEKMGYGRANVEKAIAQARAEGTSDQNALRRAYQIINEGRGEESMRQGVAFGRHETFNDESHGVLGHVLINLSNAAQRKPILKPFILFAKISANVANMYLDYTPYGFVRAARGQQMLANGKVESFEGMYDNKAADLRTKATLGTSVAIGIGLMAMKALEEWQDDPDKDKKKPFFTITGNGPRNPALRSIWRSDGNKPFSIRFGDGRAVSYAWSPLAMVLAPVGYMMDTLRHKGEDADAESETSTMERIAWVSISGMTEFLMRSLPLATMNNFLGSFNATSEEQMVKKLYNFFGGFTQFAVPNILLQADKFMDPTMYKASDLHLSFVRSIPWARRSLNPSLNLFGEPIENHPMERFAGKPINDPEFSFLIAHNLATVGPRQQKIIDAQTGQNREATEEENYRLVELFGAL